MQLPITLHVVSTLTSKFYTPSDENQQEQQDPRNGREMIQDAIAQEAPITRTRVKKMQELIEEVVA